MPAKRNTQVKPNAIDGSFFCNGKPLVLPKENRATLENHIINRIRIMDNITLTSGLKLLRTALKNNKLSVNVGTNLSDSKEEHESSHHPLSPQYKYCGTDIRKLEPLLITDNTMLECTAPL